MHRIHYTNTVHLFFWSGRRVQSEIICEVQAQGLRREFRYDGKVGGRLVLAWVGGQYC
jgi:hypothetical protein